MLCKYVSINATEYQLTVNDTLTPPDVSIAIDFNVTKILIKDNKDLIMAEVTDDGRLNVLSAVSLLLTMLTYLIVPELRTMAGLNNFFLSCSLLLAQVFSLASGWVYAEHLQKSFEDVPEELSLTNFLYVTCMGDMRNYTEQQSFSPKLYGRTSPSSLATNWGITVAAPVLIITAANVTFFLKVVYTIYKVRRTLQSMEAVGSDFDFKIYMKLSTVTGIFWIVAFLGESMANDTLKLMSVVLNGLQGVAIFYSFVCNRRVLMYWKTFYKDINNVIAKAMGTISPLQKRVYYNTLQINNPKALV
uniref:G-protein coupled receptors family 2 profile 2 domain-containing protein n=1 Tax=Biomphalaria glabrata TaxID=6526 RepID=A0A2C9L427_BIOGL